MNKFKEVSPSLRAIDGKEYEKEQYEEIIDKKTKKSQKRIKIKQNGKIPSHNQLEKASQNGETNIKVPLQNMANIKSYFKELYNDECERFEKLPEIVREIDENQEEYEKKLRLQRDKDETTRQEIKKLQEQYEAEQSSKANQSVKSIDTDPTEEETINESDSDEEQMLQNASCPNFDELADENQDYSE